MGFRLNIAKEPPNIDNNNLYIFNNENVISEGGTWEADIFKIIDENAETVNITKQQCNIYPNCIMCDCSDDSWIKISIINLINKDEYLKNNSNIAMAFLLNDISDDDYNTYKFCSYNYIINKSHREYIWVNIS